MGVVNNLSSAITKADASQPPQVVPEYLSGGHPRFSIGMAEVAAADSDTSVYRMCRVPSGAIILRIEVLNDAIAGGTDYDIGLYQTARNGGAVASATKFANTLDMTVARTLPFDAMFENLNIDQMEKRVWELLGLAADNFSEYDICYTANTVGSAAGTLGLRVYWSF